MISLSTHFYTYDTYLLVLAHCIRTSLISFLIQLRTLSLMLTRLTLLKEFFTSPLNHLACQIERSPKRRRGIQR